MRQVENGAPARWKHRTVPIVARNHMLLCYRRRPGVKRVQCVGKKRTRRDAAQMIVDIDIDHDLTPHPLGSHPTFTKPITARVHLRLYIRTYTK